MRTAMHCDSRSGTLNWSVSKWRCSGRKSTAWRSDADSMALCASLARLSIDSLQQATHEAMDFTAMQERDYIVLEKSRYLVESAWSNLAVQLLYIMPMAQYKLMVKGCLYLLAEFVFESTLRLQHVAARSRGCSWPTTAT